jgi:hypothetical protein
MTLLGSSDTEVEVDRISVKRGWGLGKGSPFPSGGSRAKPAPSWLKRSAAFRGQSPREEGVQGEETHKLWRSVARASSMDATVVLGVILRLLIPRETLFGLESPGSRERGRTRATAHATASSTSAGVLYPSEEWRRWRL